MGSFISRGYVDSQIGLNTDLVCPYYRDKDTRRSQSQQKDKRVEEGGTKFDKSEFERWKDTLQARVKE